MNPIADEILMHYGVKRRSGRYPWGSGEDPYQRTGDFLSRIDELKKSGMTEKEIAESMGLTTTQLRVQKSLAKDQRRQLEVDRAKSLKEDGLNNSEIGRIMGKNESSIRSLLDGESEMRMNQAKATAEFIKKSIDEKGIIDIGAGVERELGVSREKLNEAVEMLKMEGYEVYGRGMAQVTNPGKQTILKVICPPGTEQADLYNSDVQINSLKEYTSHDGGDTFDKFVYPKSMDSNRVLVRYAEEGGIDKDGLIEIRRGVDDLSLGESRYAQVRILVDDSKYIKGMAVYSDNIPDGVDLVFNTNKKLGTPKGDVLKNIKDDPDNPFGSLIKANGQSYYIDKDGNRQLSLINKRAEEGDWGEWSDKLSSQFLSKQNISLVNKQLGLALADKQAEFDEICSLTNPTVKKALLNSFAEDCDSASVHLKAAALPRQKYQVIIPIPQLKDNEVYAPNFDPGEKVALIRYPHGGTFEIPILTVNNKNASAKKVLGSNPLDAIGINSKVAERLSGADFDGDTVMVIPTRGNGRNLNVNITSTPALKGLEGFDPKMSYGTTKQGDDYYNSSGKKIKVMKNTQTEMGIVSNLITDMTLKGATEDELARAVRHSMVVIDAEKHKLDYKKSESDNGIGALKKKYQGSYDDDGNYSEGASSIISRSKSTAYVDKRVGTPKVNQKGKEWYDPSRPEGALIYKTVKEEYTDPKTGKVKTRNQKSTKMAETDDARTLISDSNTVTEKAYAKYANDLKGLANKARLESVNTGKIAMSPSAKATYKQEVESLNNKLDIALKNAPRERQAQVIANNTVAAKKQANPDMTKGEVKKASQQALTQARLQVGAKRNPIDITDREWEAIQAGAISDSKLKQILTYTDTDKIKERAMPRNDGTLSTAKLNKIQAMSNAGYSTADIAKSLGVSSSTVTKYLK